VIDLIRSDERLFPVGRLDRNSEGLILVTNDGELSNKLTHPRYGIEKTYRCRVAGQPTPELLGKLKRGVRLSDGMARMASVIVKRRYKESTELEIVLNEGRNREIRRVLARIGHKVLSLKRIAIGPLRLGDLPLGAHRMLEREEISRLRHALDARQAAAKAKQSPDNETGKSNAGKRKSTTGARKSTAGAEDQRRHQRGKPAAKRRAPATSSGLQEVAAPRTGTILGSDDEAQPTKKQSAPKRGAKKRPTKRAAPKRPAAKRPPRKKAKTTRKKRR
jgi:23S rRNA pseudouridine2605 synthase